MSAGLAKSWVATWCPFLTPTPSPNTPPADWACPILSLELSIQPSLNAILIPPHLRSPAGTASLTPSSQALSEAQTGSDWQSPDATAPLTNSS